MCMCVVESQHVQAHVHVHLQMVPGWIKAVPASLERACFNRACVLSEPPRPSTHTIPSVAMANQNFWWGT